MENNLITVGPLKKVTLEYTAGASPEDNSLVTTPEKLEFVYGVGTDGLTRFECALEGKKKGDKGLFEVETDKLSEALGHIIPCSQSFPVNPGHFYLQYHVINIADATSSEVVKSLAAAAGGCDGDCGCGCGFH